MTLKHNIHKTSAYKSWVLMLRRCTKQGWTDYKHYGGRGISVCDRWLDFNNFFCDMGERPIGMSLDRINNDGNYEPANCRWATHTEQMRNRRNNINITMNGKTQCISQWAKELGFDPETIRIRLLKKWPVERVLSKDFRPK